MLVCWCIWRRLCCICVVSLFVCVMVVNVCVSSCKVMRLISMFGLIFRLSGVVVVLFS